MLQEKKLVKKTNALVFLWILHLEGSQWAKNHSSCVKYQYYRRKVLDTPRGRLGALIYMRPEGESFGEGLKLMVQCLRVGLATQGTRVWSLVQEDPERLGTAIGPCATTVAPALQSLGAAPTESQALLLLKPNALESMFFNKKLPQGEARALRLERKSVHSNEDPA